MKPNDMEMLQSQLKNLDAKTLNSLITAIGALFGVDTGKLSSKVKSPEALQEMVMKLSSANIGLEKATKNPAQMEAMLKNPEMRAKIKQLLEE